ncbi:hypothetical protein DPMN_058323 [Dreissena polymorpha]|uniref:Uncharacterized protein n=1 Tax=Dreissena polymorpha TaxID=45954 RepID=A0A9D4HFZ9_DREPO|nr:hypothetical protein DPMN_058323 [Dreissena polymorpha]
MNLFNDKNIIRSNDLTKFKEDWKQIVSSRALTKIRFHYDDVQTINVASRYGIDLTSQIRNTLPFVKPQGEPTNTSGIIKGGQASRNTSETFLSRGSQREIEDADI